MTAIRMPRTPTPTPAHDEPPVWASDKERDNLAIQYLKRTGNEDMIRILGLDGAPIRLDPKAK